MLHLVLSIIALCVLLFGMIALWRFPTLNVYGLLGLMVLGEVGRITFAGQEIALYDLAVLLVATLGILRLWWQGRPIQLGKLGLPFLLFLGIAALSLLLAQSDTSFMERVVSSLYLVRLCSYFLLYIVIRNDAPALPALINGILLTAIALAGLGFVQLVLLPDFTAFSEFGWDPHQGRLLSTWFDPNFLGGFFGFILLLLLHYLYTPRLQKLQRLLLWGVVLLLLAAIYFTFSRSAYLMLLSGLILTGIFRSPRLVLAGFIVFFLLIGLNGRAQERVDDLMQSVLAFGTNSYDYSLDETSKLRVISWQQAVDIFEESPWLGVGYNTLRYEKANRGMLLDIDSHSGSGSDSSMLTLLATTGLIGTLFFGWIFVTMLVSSFFRQGSGNTTPARRNFGLGLGTGLLALLVHSLTVNSLLLPFMLTFVLLCYAAFEKSISPGGKTA